MINLFGTMTPKEWTRVRSGYKLAMNHRESLLGSSGRQISMLCIAKIMDATFSRFVAECFAIREGLL